MKPTYHGIEKLKTSLMTKVQTDKVNVSALIETFENNLDKHQSEDWLTRYASTKAIYKELFTLGELSEDTLENTDFEILEIAYEHMTEEFDTFFKKPMPQASDYYYEYARSLGVEYAASRLKPQLSEECDFI